jgi:uncharacterized membrane protein YkvA (DUF1232 family)
MEHFVALNAAPRSGVEGIVGGKTGNPTDILARCPDETNSDAVRRPEPTSAMSWRQQAQRVQTQAHVFYLAFKHPRMPWYARLVAACAAGYLLSPIQLIPSFIPVIGFSDDLLVLFLGVKLLQRITPPDVLIECRQHAADAELRRKEEVRSTAATVAAIVVAAVWILVAAAVNGLMAAYLRR